MTADHAIREAAVVLADLPGLGPGRLRRLIEAFGVINALERLRHRDLGSVASLVHVDRAEAAELLDLWAAALASPDRGRIESVLAAGRVTALGCSDYPAALVDDPARPAVLFWRGDLALLESPRVAVVGTRRATALGRTIAADLGADLASAGVAVVSGLADGIDAAAHRGTLQAGGIAVAVVGSGLDRPYPPGNRRLWDDVASRGLLLTEAPLGGAPEAWRFPSRNRIIAALAQVVVVVESGRAGGSMITVREALSRDRTVLAVPGSVRSAASEGTNQLLADGIGPARDAADVLVALGLSTSQLMFDHRPKPQSEAQSVLDVLSTGSATLEDLVDRSGQAAVAVAAHLGWLMGAGWVVADGGWYSLAPVVR